MTSYTFRDLLRSTLAEVERSSDLPQDGPAFVGLRDSLIRAIAELAVLRNEQPDLDFTSAVPILESSKRPNHNWSFSARTSRLSCTRALWRRPLSCSVSRGWPHDRRPHDLRSGGIIRL